MSDNMSDISIFSTISGRFNPRGKPKSSVKVLILLRSATIIRVFNKKNSLFIQKYFLCTIALQGPNEVDTRFSPPRPGSWYLPTAGGGYQDPGQGGEY